MTELHPNPCNTKTHPLLGRRGFIGGNNGENIIKMDYLHMFETMNILAGAVNFLDGIQERKTL